MKIRSRLTLQFVVIVASILLLFSILIYYFSASYRAKEFDERLVQKGLTTASLLVKVDEVDLKLLRIIDKNNLTALPNEKITIYDSKFKFVYSSDDEPEIYIGENTFNNIKTKNQYAFDSENQEAIGLLYKEKNNEFYVVVSAYDEFGYNKLKNLQLILLIGFLTSVVATFIAGWFFSGQAMAPISKIVNQVKEISATNLHSRLITKKEEDEIGQLALQFNQMLERLELSFQMQKNFVSNASHELRTPLSTIMAQLEVALSHKRNTDEYESFLQSVLDEVKKMISLTNGLLDFAQLKADTYSALSKKIRIDELVFQIISDLTKKYPDNQIVFSFPEEYEEERMFIVFGNDVLLKTAIQNIIENSCKYSNEGPIVAELKFEGTEIVIKITDKGIGIKSGDLPHIFDAFYRGSNARSFSGHGIGLSLSQKIIEMHKGRIFINSQIGKGTNVTIQLPVTS